MRFLGGSRAGELDSMDDTIAHASALLTMSSTWAEAWANEIGPLHSGRRSSSFSGEFSGSGSSSRF
ncbi:DUF5129 domain-containing protein [Actinomyces oricola]